MFLLVDGRIKIITDPDPRGRKLKDPGPEHWD
jgi:hypothetical protein